MSEIEKTTAKITSFHQLLLAAGATIGCVIGGFIWVEKSIVERQSTTISEEVIEKISKEISPLSSEEFYNYVKDNEARQSTVEAFSLDYMSTVDSSLMIILPQLAVNDKIILKRIALIETKFDASKAPDTESALTKVWVYLDEQAKRDSAEARHIEIMKMLQEINEKKFIVPGKKGDRIE